jgi:hypothetical protein
VQDNSPTDLVSLWYVCALTNKQHGGLPPCGSGKCNVPRVRDTWHLPWNASGQCVDADQHRVQGVLKNRVQPILNCLGQGLRVVVTLAE